MADPMMMQGQGQQPQPQQQGDQGGDVGKLIEGVGMGLQKLAEVLPPEMAGRIGELVTEFQSILSGESEHEPGENEGEEMQAMGGKMPANASINSKPMY